MPLAANACAWRQGPEVNRKTASNNGKLLPVRHGFDFDIPMGFRQIQTHDLSAWDGSPQDQKIKEIVSQIEAMGNQRFAALTLQFQGRVGEKLAAQSDTVKLGAAVVKSAVNLTLLGLPLHRYFVGSALMAGVLAVLLTLVSSADAPLVETFGISFAEGLVFSFIVRALHQFVIISKGLSARHFFDGALRFWLCFSAIAAVIGVTLFAYHDDLRIIVYDFPVAFMEALGAVVLLRAAIALFNAPVRAQKTS